MTVLKQRG